MSTLTSALAGAGAQSKKPNVSHRHHFAWQSELSRCLLSYKSGKDSGKNQHVLTICTTVLNDSENKQ